MRKKRITGIALLLIIMLSALILLSGCSEKTPEEIFTKTIHDFDGHRVVNLDEQEDTNFVVYAEGVHEIQITDSSNILVATDAENLVYTFSKPDDQLSAMEEGDVIWAEASQHNPDGLAVKVKKTVRSGEEFTVYSEAVALEDLFTYVDIDMGMSLNNVYYDASQLEDGMEILTGNDAAASLAAEPEKTDSAQVVPLVSTTGDWSGEKAVQIVFKNNIDLSFGKGIDASSGGAAGSKHLTAEHQVAIRQIRVRFKYSLEHRYFFSDVSCDGEESNTYSVEFEGSWSNGKGGMGKAWPVFCVPIPYTPIKVNGELFQLTTLSGSMKGSFQQSTSFTMGTGTNIQNLAETEPQPYCTETESTSKASMELEGKIEVLFGSRLDVGVPFVADVFVETSIGPSLTGKLDMVQRNENGSIHDCDRCQDGDVNLIIRTECGADARLVSAITGYDLVVKKNLGEISTKLGDFYASYRQDVENGVECGWGRMSTFAMGNDHYCVNTGG